jgi:hypothetical protein
MIGSLIIYFLQELFKIFSHFYTSTGLKWFICLTCFVLNFFSYYQNPTLFTDSKNCHGMSCRWFNFIAGMGNLTLNLIGLIGLWYIAPFSKYLPNYWYVPVIILSYALLIQITLSVKVTTDDGNFNPPPEDLWPKKYRILLNVIIFILDIIFFHQLYLDGGKQLYNNPTILDDFILSRFGGWNESKFDFVLGWYGIIGFILDILCINNIASFKACNYNLPSSWDF